MGRCMCGADDCPACYPGIHDWRECSRCGEEFRRIDLEGGLCAMCLEEIEAKDAAEDRAADEAEDRRRENLADEQNGKVAV